MSTKDSDAPDSYCGDPQGTIYDCTGGRWVSGPIYSCNPPPPPLEECPTEQPIAGSGCYVNPMLACTYVTSYCCGVPNGKTSFSCQNYAWQSSGGSVSGCAIPSPSCPPIAPKDGEPCCFVGPESGCSYGCGLEGAAYATCDGSHWRVLHAISNPPPPPQDAGPPFDIDAAGYAAK